MPSPPELMSDQGYPYHEEAEARAFNRIADESDKSRLVTTEWTFSRYRNATLGRPLFDAYPDLAFSYIGSRFRRDSPEKPLTGVEVLDLGAGDGAWSVILAEQGATVVSVEVSPKAVGLARERMRIHQLHSDAHVWSAYRLRGRFPDGSFDLVFGQAVLHHLTHGLKKVYSEVCQVLKPGGSAIFTEPYSGSKVLRHMRNKLTWLLSIDQESLGERPLFPEEVQQLGQYFSKVEVYPFDLFQKFARRAFKRPSFERIFARLDGFLLRNRSSSSLRKHAVHRSEEMLNPNPSSDRADGWL